MNAVFAHPDLAFVLIGAACLAFLLEIANSGMTVPGITGVGLLVLAGLGLVQLPTTVPGLLLMAASLALLASEQFLPEPWAGALGGGLVFGTAGIILFSGGIGVSRWVLVTTAFIVTGGAVVAARTARRVRLRRRPARDPADYTGAVVTLARAEGRRGQVKLDGTWWTVQAGRDLAPGDRVRIVGRDGLVLIVDPVEDKPWTP